jgi:hypothetical protein
MLKISLFMKTKNRELKTAYKQQTPPMGVYQIRNLTNEKVFVGAALNLPGIINRHRFALQMDSHTNCRLQADWNSLGGENFAFEILDEISLVSDPQHDYRADLNFLEELWLEKLQPYDEHGYNERKKTRNERLQMIAANRRQTEESEAQ